MRAERVLARGGAVRDEVVEERILRGGIVQRVYGRSVAGEHHGPLGVGEVAPGGGVAVGARGACRGVAQYGGLSGRYVGEGDGPALGGGGAYGAALERHGVESPVVDFHELVLRGVALERRAHELRDYDVAGPWR